MIDLFRKKSAKEKAFFTLRVTTETHFLLWKNLKNVMHGLFKMFVMR